MRGHVSTSAQPPPGPISVRDAPERWVRFLENVSPGLTWLAATLLEWAELPPAARRAWRVTVQGTRDGEVDGLAALHEESGILAVACVPPRPPPFLVEPETVRRLLGTPEAVDAALSDIPMLRLRRGAGVRRSVHVYDGEGARPHPALRRAEPGSEAELGQLRADAGDPVLSPAAGDLVSAVQRGAVWVLSRAEGIVAMFRIEGVARRRVQVADACVRPDARGRGLGTAILESAAFVSRREYSRGCVVAVPAAEAAERTVVRAGFTRVGELEDVRFE
jgi:GNAT superfamily N-acetyltransferase